MTHSNGFTTANQFLEDQQHINNCIRAVPATHRQAVIAKFNELYLSGSYDNSNERYAIMGESRRKANLFLFAVKAKAEEINHAH